MQSGIRASQELLQAFNDLVSSPSQRGLIVDIRDECLVPIEKIPSSSSSNTFSSDLAAVVNLLKDDVAAYVILRRYPNAPDGYV
ncbi:MAG: Twinfilin-1, partial [Thelocarpon superellum]